MLDGTKLSYLDNEWTLPRGRTELSVASIDGQTLQLAQPLPDDLPPTDFLLVGDTGYDIESMTGDAIRVRDYPLVLGETAALLHGVTWLR